MWIAEFLFALIIALAVVALFTTGFRRRGPWGGFLTFFLVVFFGTWAIGAWIDPVGPVAWGVAWVPLLLGALFIGLLLAAATPPAPRPAVAAATETETEAGVAGIGALFWLLLLGLLIVALFPLF